MWKRVFIATGLQLRKIKTKKEINIIVTSIFVQARTRHWRTDTTGKRGVVCVCVYVWRSHRRKSPRALIRTFIIFFSWRNDRRLRRVETVWWRRGVYACHPPASLLVPTTPRLPLQATLPSLQIPLTAIKPWHGDEGLSPPYSYIAFDHSGRGFNIKFFRLGRAL